MNEITDKAKKLGEWGDDKARLMLQGMGFIVSRPDWAGYQQQSRMFFGEHIAAGEDIEFEIKAKTQQYAGGHGADIYQIEKRMRRFKKYGVRQFLLIVEANGKVYGQWLHQLERAGGKDLEKDGKKTGIRVYPIRCFCAVPNIYV